MGDGDSVERTGLIQEVGGSAKEAGLSEPHLNSKRGTKLNQKLQNEQTLATKGMTAGTYRGVKMLPRCRLTGARCARPDLTVVHWIWATTPRLDEDHRVHSSPPLDLG
jgi:hypothetical protein